MMNVLSAIDEKGGIKDGWVVCRCGQKAIQVDSYFGLVALMGVDCSRCDAPVLEPVG